MLVMLWPAIVRTITPMLVGALAVSLPGWLGLTEDQISAWVGTTLGAAYYVLVRGIEHYLPSAGWALGLPSAPTYQPLGRHRAE